EDAVDGRYGLKLDFFTSCVQQDPPTGCFHPVSLSTILQPHRTSTSSADMEANLRRSSRIAQLRIDSHGHPQSDTTETDTVLANDKSFAWEDVRNFWELKSSRQINSRGVWANMILKAAQILRFQWHRRFVLGFLVCGTQMRLFRFDRSCVLVSLPVNLGDDEGPSVLTKCILAELVAPTEAVGIPDWCAQPRIAEVDGRPRLVVSVDGKEFVLGDRISGPQRDNLTGRATSVHLARGRDDRAWRYCYKSSWPYASRLHEGGVLKELKGTPGVVRVLAWDATPMDVALTVDWILMHCRPLGVSGRRQYGFSTSVSNSTSSASQSHDSLSLLERTGDDGGGGYPQLHARQHRQTVTDYIPLSFASTQLAPLDLLQAWRSLYVVIDTIATKGWVHRDLSLSNVRLSRNDNDRSWSVTLIDFDLAARIEGSNSGSPDKTGTLAFMPLEVLESDPQFPVRHQELHEDEAAFWVGFLRFISRSAAGRDRYHRLLDPKLDMSMIAGAKRSIVAQLKRWPLWFSDVVYEAKQCDLLREACAEIYSLQFEREYDREKGKHAYPDVDVVDGEGRRVHEVQHRRVLRAVVEALERWIECCEEYDTLASIRLMGL
ncbi:hypothetical protein GP486_008073, partial [Trichoglossum hirsutum]